MQIPLRTTRQDRCAARRLNGAVPRPLLQSRIDLVTIRDYLGHASLATSSRYLAINLRMKRDALQTFWKHAGIEPDPAKPWTREPDLLAFLQSL